MQFEAAYVLSTLPVLWAAALVNIRIAAIAFALAILGGTCLTILRSLKIGTVNAAISVMISFIRGTPLLIQIFLFYYVTPALGLDLSPVVAGVAAISFNSSIFISEMMRGALQTIEVGQIEAATSLALRRHVIWLRVILPQLFRRILPLLVNEATIVVKGTALLSVITVVDILRTAQQIASSNYRPFETLLAAAIVFLVINLAISAAGSSLERRLAERQG